MSNLITIALNPSSEQLQRLKDLQDTFVSACNALAPLVQQTRVWNRVALHHMAYKNLRAQFPALGSQMVCNVIYSVSRASRIVYQAPDSPFHIARLGARAMPLMRFTALCPVYFDRHTLSIKGGLASMYTLDGRIKFQVTLSPEQEASFNTCKLREVALTRHGDTFRLKFLFSDKTVSDPALALEAAGELSDFPYQTSPDVELVEATTRVQHLHLPSPQTRQARPTPPPQPGRRRGLNWQRCSALWPHR
jgi:hypothetical protein